MLLPCLLQFYWECNLKKKKYKKIWKKMLKRIWKIPFLANFSLPRVNVISQVLQEVWENLFINILGKLSQHEPISVLKTIQAIKRFLELKKISQKWKEKTRNRTWPPLQALAAYDHFPEVLDRMKVLKEVEHMQRKR